jgi:hypothetical protein
MLHYCRAEYQKGFKYPLAEHGNFFKLCLCAWNGTLADDIATLAKFLHSKVALASCPRSVGKLHARLVKGVSYSIMYWYMYGLDTGLLPPCG